jgi:hypothetical protein
MRLLSRNDVRHKAARGRKTLARSEKQLVCQRKNASGIGRQVIDCEANERLQKV